MRPERSGTCLKYTVKLPHHPASGEQSGLRQGAENQGRKEQPKGQCQPDSFPSLILLGIEDKVCFPFVAPDTSTQEALGNVDLVAQSVKMSLMALSLVLPG